MLQVLNRSIGRPALPYSLYGGSSVPGDLSPPSVRKTASDYLHHRLLVFWRQCFHSIQQLLPG